VSVYHPETIVAPDDSSSARGSAGCDVDLASAVAVLIDVFGHEPVMEVRGCGEGSSGCGKREAGEECGRRR